MGVLRVFICGPLLRVDRQDKVDSEKEKGTRKKEKGDTNMETRTEKKRPSKCEALEFGQSSNREKKNRSQKRSDFIHAFCF